MSRGARLRIPTVMILAILANGAGNVSLSHGMKLVGPLDTWTPAGVWAILVAAFSNEAVIVGALLLLIFFALFLMLLSWVELSYVLPMISFCFVVSAILGRFTLGERISAVRWLGVALVSLGVFLVGRTPPEDQAVTDRRA